MIEIRNFAVLDENNIVTGVIAGDSLESIQEMFPDNRWVETFANSEDKKLAGVGDKYDEEIDDFLSPSYEVDIDELVECGCDKAWEHLKVIPW